MNTPSSRSLKRIASVLIPMTVLLVPLAFSQAEDNALSPNQRATILRLQSLVIQRCCVQKPAAARIKADIARMVKEGKSDREILARYRDLIGAPPAVETVRLLLLPVGGALLVIASIGAKLVFRSWRRNRAARCLSVL